MRLILALLAGLWLAGCAAANTAPSYQGVDYRVPGFAAYCQAHPGVGVCP